MEKVNPFKSNSSSKNSSGSVQQKASNGKPQGINVKSSLVQRSIVDQAKEKSQKSTGSDSRTKMPEAVQAKMEGAFGADFSDVNIHQGESATAMNAHAYTQGNNIHFAPGQYSPDSKSGQELLGHELTHVVQQRKGNVAPTTQLKGVGINDDKGLEKEADVMGKKLVLEKRLL